MLACWSKKSFLIKSTWVLILPLDIQFFVGCDFPRQPLSKPWSTLNTWPMPRWEKTFRKLQCVQTTKNFISRNVLVNNFIYLMCNSAVCHTNCLCCSVKFFCRCWTLLLLWLPKAYFNFNGVIAANPFYKYYSGARN